MNSTRLIQWTAVVLLGLSALAAVRYFEPAYRRPPEPTGMIARATVGRVHHPMQRILVAPAPHRAGAIEILVPGPSSGTVDELWELDVASGTCRAVQSSAPMAPAPPFDFDGDGIVDRIRRGAERNYGLIEVLSGASGKVLFSDRDPLHYENDDRAFPVGDLDGDGCSELALVHPRDDRSEYDPHLYDAVFGARSWVTVVAGRRSSK